MKPGQYNENIDSNRHRCSKCKRIRTYKVMVCWHVVSNNQRDSKWKCIDCKSGRNKKRKTKRK